MIQFTPDDPNPSRESVDCFIGTAAAIALAVSAAATSGGAAYAAHTSSDAANHAADVQGTANDKALAFQEQQAADAKAQFQQSQRANYEQYAARHKAAQQLGDSIGFHLPDLKTYEEYTGQPAPSGTPTTGARAASAGPDALKALIQQYGPQVGAQKFNQQFGRTTGNEAVYYPENGGTVGIPEGYFSNGAQGWNFAPRGGAAGSVGGQAAPFASPTIASAIAQMGGSTSLTPPPQTQPFQLRSINAFVR
jgi:hypothetical protein